ncbi:asparagine synthase (glutamine-hydrolyzing) [Nocardia terpenica]|uniref:asparagine synthase (glutamine-hydrolyzing) n=1 Tax=Nocardia terpenica TaxID=455432 RepID=A0A164LE08_9NOCA|nr:asparagine synthase (glutamine-hydrolyzing) [Nocardia terpenica]KZM72305.1 asparagine synthetase B [Nocardia terpenica]NQE86812.1 asparagine synthase (glutamine-hydrolyzing) [Nocardia terpenica]
MCGIAGWVSFGEDLSSRKSTLEAMTATMSCRGPDESGTWLGAHVALGHRRLAVIDLPGGTQPMVIDTPQGPVATVYSGETYNFIELRDELRRQGTTFRTDSDTEVVLRGYLKWGEAVVDRLNGMYGFAIWDSRVDKLVMIRDRMGIKPFYYYPIDGGVLFGSEPKAILANPLADALVCLDGLREILTFAKTPGHAVWEGMRELRPGHFAVLDRTGLRERCYWKLQAEEHTDDQPTTVARVRELLDDIIHRQLIADVPKCTLLSGGLDSSAMTALAAAELQRQGEVVRSFAVDFAQQADNFRANEISLTHDTPYVHLLAEHIACEHKDIVLDGTEMADPAVRAASVGARDFPGAFGDRDNSLYLLFKAIRERSTVALSGESSDEIFGGYPWFHVDAMRSIDGFPWLGNQNSPLRATGMLDPYLVGKLDLETYAADQYRQALREVPHRESESGLERRMREVCHLSLTRVLRLMLDRKDRISMAVGLEVRVPYCDHRLVQYVFNTPWSMKTYDGREKSILRGATRNLLPAVVADRKKSGYPGSYDPHYLTAIQDQVRGLVTNGHPVIDLYNREEVLAASNTTVDTITPAQRFGIERFLDFATWLDLRKPTLKLD